MSIIQNHPTPNQISSLIRYHLETRDTISEVFDLKNSWEELSKMTIGQYKRLLALEFDNKIIDLKNMLVQLGVKRKLIK